MIDMFDAPIARSFLTDGESGEGSSEGSGEGSGDRPLPIILPFYFHPLAPGQEQLRILLISSPTWVTETIAVLMLVKCIRVGAIRQFALRSVPHQIDNCYIHDLHARGFADPNDWSSLVPGANPDEVVSILTRRRQRP